MEDGVSYKAWGNVSGAGSHYSHAFPTKKEEYKQKLLKHLEKCVVWEDGVPSLFCGRHNKTHWFVVFLCNVTGNQCGGLGERRCSKTQLVGLKFISSSKPWRG